MKYIINTWILFCLASGCCFGQTYVIQGKVEGLQSDSLMILKFKGENIVAAKIKVSKRVFKFKDSISEPYFIQILKLSKETGKTDGKLTELLVESGKITIKGSSDNYESIKIKGSKSDLVLKKYLEEDKNLQKKWDSLYTIYEDYVLKEDTVNRKSVGQKLNKITFEQRVPLLKKYVRDYNDNIIGALIPNFCTLQEVLKKEDYLEIYNLLNEKMRKTNYGQNIFEKTK
jgi:hypothetical protein